MVADKEGQRSQHNQRPEARTVQVENGQQQRQYRRPGIQHMPTGQLAGFTIDLASQLTKGNHRAGERHRADKDAQHNFDLQEHQLIRGFRRD